MSATRAPTAKPVLDIAECGILTALTLDHRFGVISILARLVPRHQRYRNGDRPQPCRLGGAVQIRGAVS
jgi:hypothetical protein